MASLLLLDDENPRAILLRSARRQLMAEDFDNPDDSNQPRHKPGSVREETSATGQRVKGAVKDAVGDMIDDEDLEEKGERENAAGRDRQKKNDAV
jgi:uncharacterized protein YjbJ (UPF0337 family)